MSAIQESDSQEYMRCLLGRRTFSKTYTVCGTLAFTLQTMTTAGRQRLSAFTRWCESTRPDVADDTLDRANLEFRSADAEALLVKSNEELFALFCSKYDALSDEIYRAQLQCLSDFITLVEELRGKVLEKDFWKGAGQG